MNWKQAFRKQAISDFEVFKTLSKSGRLPDCHSLHYLQMSVEKIAKSFLCCGDENPKKTHTVIKPFVNVLKCNTSVQRYFGFKNKRAFNSFIMQLIIVAEQIENLSPASSKSDDNEQFNKPNAEYPWQKPDSDIIAPADFDGFVKIKNMVDYSRFQWFIEKMLIYEQ